MFLTVQTFCEQSFDVVSFSYPKRRFLIPSVSCKTVQLSVSTDNCIAGIKIVLRLIILTLSIACRKVRISQPIRVHVRVYLTLAFEHVRASGTIFMFSYSCWQRTEGAKRSSSEPDNWWVRTSVAEWELGNH